MIEITPEYLLSRAAYELTGNIPGSLIVRGEPEYENIVWDKTLIPNPPTKEQIEQKIEDLIAEEPYRRLRIHRDILLKECDWVTLSDVSLSDEKKTAWLNYRQALRDLPSNSTPELDGPFVKNVEWPQKP